MYNKFLDYNGNIGLDFYCYSADTKHGFKHVCKLYVNPNYQKYTATVYYYNRTWETYRYQTVMQKALKKYIDTLYTELIDNYKNKNDYKKMTKKRYMELRNTCEYKKLNEMRTELFNELEVE